MENKQKTILIGMPSYGGLIPATMVQSLLQLHKPLPCAFMIVERQRIDKARNGIALEALKQGIDYLFFVDDDNPIPPDTLEKLLEDDKDVIIAPILGRNPDKNGRHPLCAFYKEEVIADGKKINLYRNIEEFRDDGPLHRIDAAGTGCMLIKRKVLEKMFKKYGEYMFEFGDIKFKKPIKVDGKKYERRTMSEDCEFSERVVKEGFEIWLDDRIRPLHVTTYNLVQYKD
jgi:glycosyltransferase involved in cell wall biosynthesis